LNDQISKTPFRVLYNKWVQDCFSVMAQNGDLVFVGVAHPPQGPTPPTKDVGVNQFCSDNLRDMKLTGLPVGYEHEHPVGTIIHSATGAQSTKLIVGHIPEHEKATIERIENGDLPDLSLTHTFSVWNEEDGTEIQERQPIEVSLTKKGNRPGCKIIHTHRLPTRSTEYIRKKPLPQETMAEELSLADYGDEEKIKALGWSQEDMMKAFVEATGALLRANERTTELEQESEAMRKQKEELEAMSQKQLDELKEQLKTYLTPEGQEAPENLTKALTAFDSPTSVEQSDMLRMIVQNAADRQEYIHRLEGELQKHREGVQMVQQAKKNPALAHFTNTVSNLRSEPLQKAEKRFASEAMAEAVDPMDALRSSFLQKGSKMPRMVYQ